MAREACRYIVVRFVPNVVRDEPLNIGVILQCPEKEFITAKFATKFTRVAKLYPDVDLNLLRSFADDMTDRIEAFTHGKQLALGELPREEPVPLSSPAFLDFLFEEYGGRLQFTKPQPTLAEDLEAEISSLFGIFVELPSERERRKVKRAPVTHPMVRRRVREVFEEAKVMDYLQRGVRVKGKRWEYDFDFAYVNRHKGLIQSVAFDLVSPEDKRDRAFSIGGMIDDVIREREFEQFAFILQPPEPDRAEGYEKAKDYLRDMPSTLIEMEEAAEYAASLRRTFEPTLFDELSNHPGQ